MSTPEMTLQPVWFKGLTPELQRKAEVELGETPAVKERALNALRRLVSNQSGIQSRQDDLFLLRFLRAKKYDVEKAFKVFRNYHAMRTKHWGVFTGKKPSELRHVLDMDFAWYAAHRLPSGSHVGLYQVGRFNLVKAASEDFFATMLLVGEIELECESSQVSGGIYVFDFKGMSLQHYTHFLNIKFLSLTLSVLQDSWPERFKGLHFVNEPLIMKALYKMIWPILKEKFKKRVHFHGGNLDSLHDLVPKDFLPEEYGGNTGPFDNREFADYILRQESYIEKMNNNNY